MHIKRKEYTVLIPEGIEDMAASAGHHKDRESFIGGNRGVMDAVLTSFYLLALGREALLYFPARQCEGWKCEAAYWREEEWEREVFYDTDMKDVVFLNHTLQFPVGHWDQVLHQIKRQKPKIIRIRYQEKKMAEVFRNGKVTWDNLRYIHKKEVAREVIRNHTAFYVISRMIARLAFCDLEEMLDGDEIQEKMDSLGKEYWSSPCWTSFHLDIREELMLMYLDYGWYMGIMDRPWSETKKEPEQEKDRSGMART